MQLVLKNSEIINEIKHRVPIDRITLKRAAKSLLRMRLKQRRIVIMNMCGTFACMSALGSVQGSVLLSLHDSYILASPVATWRLGKCN
jgi:hypothetical protein